MVATQPVTMLDTGITSIPLPNVRSTVPAPSTAVQSGQPVKGKDAAGAESGGEGSGGKLRFDEEAFTLSGLAAEAAEDGDNPDGLTPEEEQQVEDLKARDAEVRRHEEAHAAVGGQYAGAPTYEYQTGPDGRQYAVGGSVQIDISPVPDDPEATIDKMDVVIRAALAPQEPSPQDYRVASKARQQQVEAQGELRELQVAELAGETTGSDRATGAYQAASGLGGPTAANENTGLDLAA